MDLKSIFRTVPDFPKPGINFIDITPLLLNPGAFAWTIDELAKPYEGRKIDKIVSIESRGFLFGAPLALKLNAGLVVLRKPNKLPWETYSQSYDLEYGQATIEVHKDSLQPGETVVVIDDLLATGGTLGAALELMKRCECKVEGVSCVVELTFLNGRGALQPNPVHTIVTYDAE
ncbi:MAG: adenine phosphoribosyltransferase [bacterium]|nr:adenine phosphoribosyltransferase [bacterium]